MPRDQPDSSHTTPSNDLDRQPVLVGQSVTLRPLRADDREDLYSVAQDPGIWEQHPDPDRYRRDHFDEFFEVAMRSRGALVVLDDAGLVIGSSRFDGFDPERSLVEIGWTFLSRSHWGGTTNAEVKRLMLDHAFKTVERVIFVIGPDNLRSQRAIEKLGGKLVGERDVGSQSPHAVFEIRAGRLLRNRGPGRADGANGEPDRRRQAS